MRVPLTEDRRALMAASAILLFGSRAREDHDRASDTDLLFICEEPHPRHVSAGRTSMFFYPWAKLLADASAGDLFVGHLAQEARALSDPSDKLGQLKASFRLRDSYQREIEHARDLGWFISRFPQKLKPSLMTKRMIWCVRTVLIARFAEEGKLVFAPNTLAEMARSKAASDLLMERRRRLPDEKMQKAFRRFLLTATDRERWHREESEAYFIGKFIDTLNDVAIKTLEQNSVSASSTYT